MVGVGCLGWFQSLLFVPSLMKRLAGLVVAAAAADVLAVAGFPDVSFKPFGGQICVFEHTELAIVGDGHNGPTVAATMFLAVFGAVFVEVLPAFLHPSLAFLAEVVVPVFAFVMGRESFQESSCELISGGSGCW